jgi:hypothetical protein
MASPTANCMNTASNMGEPAMQKRIGGRSAGQGHSTYSTFLCLALLLTLGACATAHAADGDLLWASVLGGGGECRTFDVATDAAGNVYILGGFYGYFGETVDLDPGPGVVIRSSPDPAVFLVKLDAAGNYLWDREWDLGWYGPIDTLLSLAVDTGGNVYIGGVFCSTHDFDPNFGTCYLSPNFPSSSTYSAFVLKLDTNGNFRWAKSIGASVIGTDSCLERQLAIDPSGNVILIGTFHDSADFDPGPGVAMLTIQYEPCKRNVFIVKLNPDGNLVWAKSLEGAPWQLCQETSKVTTDAEGNIILAIPHSSAFDVDPGEGVVLVPDVPGTALVKLDAAGNLVWAQPKEGAGFPLCVDISAKNGTDILLVGAFGGLVDLDPGPGTVLRNGGSVLDQVESTFLMKLNGSGDFCWVKTMAGEKSSFARSVTVDTDGNVYAAGLYRDGSSFLDDYALPLPIEHGQPFLFKTTPSGDLVWFRVVGSRSRNGFCYDSMFLATGPDNSVYMTKPFYDSMDFDSGPGVAFLTNTPNPGSNNSSAILKFDRGIGSEAGDPPSPQVSALIPAPAEVSPIPMTVTFSAAVTGFEASDLRVNNGTVSNFAGSGAGYTFDLVPLSAGLVTVNVDAGAAKDGYGRDTLAAVTFQIAYMPLPPNPDSDGDGMPDAWEALYGLDPHSAADAGQDIDGDGLTALQEFQFGGAPNMEDTDGDGYWDAVEMRAGTGLSDAAQMPSAPQHGDVDRNGRADAVDVQIVINAALGKPTPCPANLTGSAGVDALDVQMVINCALGK